MTSLISRKLQAEKRGKMSPFAKGDPVTLVLRIAYDQHRAPNMRALRVSADALSRRVQADLKNAEFVWRPTAQDIRWCSDTQETVEVFWSSRAQSKLQEDLTTTAFGLFEDDMQKLGMNAMVMYQLSGDSREVTRDSFRLWFRYAGKGEPKVALSRLLFTSETNDPGSSRGGRSPSPSMHSPTMALEPMHISPDGGQALGNPRSRKDLHRSPSPNILGRRPEHRRTRSPEVRRSPQAHRRSFSPPPRRGSSSVPHDYSPALGRRVRTPPPARISPPSADDEESFSQGARLIAMGYLLDQVQMRTSVLEEMLSERAQSSADYRARAPKLQKDLAEAEKVLQACEASEGHLRSIAQKVGIGDAQDGDKLDLLRSFELRLRMLKEKVALEEKLQRDAEANLERERDRHNSLLARLERQQQQQQQFMPGYGMSGMHPMTGVQPMHGPMGGPLGPQFFGHGGGPPSW